MHDIKSDTGLESCAEFDFKEGEYFRDDNADEHNRLITKLNKNSLYLSGKNRAFIQNFQNLSPRTKPIRPHPMQCLNEFIDEIRLWKQFYINEENEEPQKRIFQEQPKPHEIKNPFERYDPKYELFLEDMVYYVLGEKSRHSSLSFARVLKMKQIVQSYRQENEDDGSLKILLIEMYCKRRKDHFSSEQLGKFVDYLFLMFSKLDEIDLADYPQLQKSVLMMQCENSLCPE